MDSLTASQDPSGWRQAAADDQAAQIGALKSELESLKESVAAISATARSLASTSVNVAAADIEDVLKRNVFASLGTAAFISYVWGRIG